MTSSPPAATRGCHRQKTQGLGRTAVSYEKVEAVPTSQAHPAKVTGKHKAGNTAHVHGCEEPTHNDRTSNLLRYRESAFIFYIPRSTGPLKGT